MKKPEELLMSSARREKVIPWYLSCINLGTIVSLFYMIVGSLLCVVGKVYWGLCYAFLGLALFIMTLMFVNNFQYHSLVWRLERDGVLKKVKK